MKMKTILIIALAVAAAGSVLTLAPRNVLAAETRSSGPKILSYACPMHPSVKSDKPGNCQICGMTLQPVYDKIVGTNAPPTTVNTNRPATESSGCCSSDGGCCN